MNVSGADETSARRPDRDRFLKAIAVRVAADEQSRCEFWREATPAERGRVLAELLDLVDAIGQHPPKREMFPGFPGSRARHG